MTNGSLEGLAELCALSYSGPHESAPAHRKRVKQELEERGHTDVGFLDYGGTQVFFCRTGNDVTVVFRGTDRDIRDLKTDVKGLKAADVFGRVHGGVANALDKVWLKLRDEIADRSQPGGKVTLTGHSLGGMLAYLAAARLVHEAVCLGEVVSFGSPPVGNFTFATVLGYVLRGKLWRVVHHADIIPRLISQRMFLYFHCGTLVWIDGAGQVMEKPGFWKRMSAISRNLHRSVSDHFICNYLSAIRGDD